VGNLARYRQDSFCVWYRPTRNRYRPGPAVCRINRRTIAKEPDRKQSSGFSENQKRGCQRLIRVSTFVGVRTQKSS
jgi:hypothetical protein